jgi:protein-S-isoprenylcysteine O-methyltransferase Ste14
MAELGMFKTSATALVALFLLYGMDVRRREGARNFVAPVWQALMKLCAFTLIGGFIGIATVAKQVSVLDWLALVVMAAGTAFVVTAKRALGSAHTFTGQFLDEPRLVTHGVFAHTRNPLYLGVFLCEAGAALFAAHQAPLLFPQSHLYWPAALATPLIYAVVFNWKMARNEALYLEHCFGNAYRTYAARVPFLIPTLSLRKEAE